MMKSKFLTTNQENMNYTHKTKFQRTKIIEKN